jgi:hypothetical protein
LLSEARADLLVDHPPIFNGPSSDTDYRNEVSQPYWQLLADDFMLASDAQITQVRWWGLYGNHFGGGSNSTLPPVGDETMRIRLYIARLSDGLPGQVLTERFILNAARADTGMTGDFGTGAHIYVYSTDLPVALEIQASTRYWIEIVQFGIPSSVFRWSFSEAPNDAFVGINPDLQDWYLRSGANLALQLIGVPEPHGFPIAALLLVLRRAGPPRKRRCR